MGFMFVLKHDIKDVTVMRFEIRTLYIFALLVLFPHILLAESHTETILIIRDGIITVDKQGNMQVIRKVEEEVVEVEDIDDDSYFQLSLSAGIANASQHDSELVVTQSETDILKQTNDNNWSGWTVQFGLGYVVPLYWEWNDEDESETQIQWLNAITPQLNLYILNGTDLTGEVKRFNDSDDVDATYNMQFDSTRLMFDTAINILSVRDFSFFAMAGLGIAWTSTDFVMLHDSHVRIDDLDLGASNDSDFAYEFGGGINYYIDEDFDISLQYLYTRFSNVNVSGQDENFKVYSSDLDIKTQSLLLGARIKI